MDKDTLAAKLMIKTHFKEFGNYLENGWDETALRSKNSIVNNAAKKHFQRCADILETNVKYQFTKEEVKLLELNEIKISENSILK